MNATGFSLRQQKILEIIFEKPLTRIEISEKIKQYYPLSKMTLLRDLNYLVKIKKIRKNGSGSNICYSLIEKNPLFVPIDINEYFSDQSSRNSSEPIKFNSKLFNNLKKIIRPEDLKEHKIVNTRLSEQEKRLDPTIFRREIERFVIEFSWKSSRIEGNTYSLLETEVLIKQQKEASGHSKYEAIMILNHKRALDFILSNRNKFKEINLAKIINLHTILTKDLEVTSGLRNNPVAISGSNYLPLESKKEIELILNKLVNIINNISNPLEKSLVVLVLLSYIQPFTDGNKRTARVLANAILIACDYYPISFRNVEETDYLKALLLFYETNNLFYFKKMFLDQYSFALRNYFRS